MRKAGRDTRTETLPLRVTKQQRRILVEAAARSGQPLREWMREILLAAAAAPREELLLTELTGQHMLLQHSLRLILGALGMPAAQFHTTLVEIKQQKAGEAQRLRDSHLQRGRQGNTEGN